MRLADDARAADWLVAAFTTFGASVLSLAPEGFPSHVRVFHPAHVHDPEQPSKRGRPVRWSDVAAANARVVHSGMQWRSLADRCRPDIYDWPPSEGSLPHDVAVALASVLSRHTTTPAVCWFAVWTGFGTIRPELRETPTFRLPNRHYFLLTGPVDAIAENTNGASSWHQSANLGWPEDRAWCVATEIDLDTTYVACAEACAEEILAIPDLEALEIDPATGISWASDLVNGAIAPG